MSPTVKTCGICGQRFGRGELYCPSDGTPLSAPGLPPAQGGGGDSLIGVTLDGRYRVLGVIGEGGMGIVYEAEHVLIEKRVAVKVLRADFTRKPDVVARFRQEAKSASRIGHPNIIDVLDFGQTPTGASYFVMEKLEGEDLAEVLSRECVLAPARAVSLVHRCCRALAAAHEKGIFHRDLKPENLFVIRNEHGGESVKVVDFGVAKMTDLAQTDSGARKLTRTGMLFGTPEYMSPEQSKGHALDHRADIYALGIILYELVTGRVPFEGENFMEVLHKHGHDPVPVISSVNPGTQISEPLRAAIFKALQKNREDRFQTMDEMAAVLSAVPEMPSLDRLDGPPPWALLPPQPPPISRGSSHDGASSAYSGPRPSRSGTTLSLAGSRRVKVGIAASVAAAAIALSLLAIPSEPPDSSFETATDPVLIEAAPSIDPAHGEAPEAQSEHPTAPDPMSAKAASTNAIKVRLGSQPAGARVEADEVGELCSATPCTVELTRGVPVLMRFSNLGVRSSARVVPEQDGQAVFVNLERQGQLKAEPRKDSKAASVERGLKIPEAFR